VQNVIHSKDSPRGFAVVRLLARVCDSLDIRHLVPMPAIGVNTFVFDGFGLLAHLLACRNIEHLAPLPATGISTTVFARMEHLAPMSQPSQLSGCEASLAYLPRKQNHTWRLLADYKCQAVYISGCRDCCWRVFFTNFKAEFNNFCCNLLFFENGIFCSIYISTQ
jgi:hypothetical protein